MTDLHESEVKLLLALADFAEKHGQPMRSHQLFSTSGIEHAEFVRRLGFLVVVGLIRIQRELPLSDRDQRLVLTGNGTLRVVAERAAKWAPEPGVRSRLSSLASTLEVPASPPRARRATMLSDARGPVQRRRPELARRTTARR